MATSPSDGGAKPRQLRHTKSYTGPPAYPLPPRWGFPGVVWRPPIAVPGTFAERATPLQRLSTLAPFVTAALWMFAAITLVSAGSEIWRYVLLVQSRDSALPAVAVAVSDALVTTGSLLAFGFALAPACLTLWWLFIARVVIATETNVDPPRSARNVLIAILVPGLNWVLAGCVVAELEHAAMRRPATKRPTPSTLVLWWWLIWVINWLLLVLVAVWRFRDGVQAEADGVLLTAGLDIAATGLAVATALVVRRITALLIPIPLHKLRLRHVLKVNGAPEPTRRIERQAGTVR